MGNTLTTTKKLYKAMQQNKMSIVMRKSALSIQSNLSFRGHTKKTKERIFKTDNHLMQVKSIAECSGQYFRLALSCHLSLRPSVNLFLSGRLRQV